MSHDQSKPGGKYVLLESTEVLPECLVYEPQESQLLAFGVDAASKPTAAAVACTNTAHDGAAHIANAITSSAMIPSSNAQVYSTPSDYDQCTASKMEQAFKQSISKVSENGLFVMAFSGSAVELNSGSKKHCICPSDFNVDDPSTHVDIAQWLSCLSKDAVRPKHLLIVLDCAFAGEISSQITNLKDASRESQGIIVLAGQNGKVTSLALDTLGHSTFSYFLAHFLRDVKFTPGLLPLRKIYSKVGEVCTAMSSLVVTYDPQKKTLKQNIVYPSASVVTRRTLSPRLQWMLHGGSDEPDQAIARFEFIAKHYIYDRKKKPPRLHGKTEAWLEGVREIDENLGPLVQLHRNGVLTSEVLQTVVASIMFSIASIEVAERKDTIADPNFFIFAYLLTHEAVDQIEPETLHQGVDTFRKAFGLYLQAVRENGLTEKKLQELLRSVEIERITTQLNGAG